ncbi:hypothetical protein FQN50_005511 [Emmonsiellopsis sp. PD_5]|nr:hypothetical protein FQN50_005511 [Emmonsiellopsis sp. PD_5]
MDVDGYYYYRPCPLCEQDVDESQPANYRVLALDHAKGALLQEIPQRTAHNSITVGDCRFVRSRSYSGVSHMQRAWLLHERCLKLVQDLPILKLYHLVDLVESTFLSRSIPPASIHGAFYHPQPDDGNGISSSQPIPSLTWSVDSMKGLWAALQGHLRITPNRPRTRFALNLAEQILRLPEEIRHMILRYDVGRLLFLLETASQLTSERSGPISIPTTRFTVEDFKLRNPVIRVHFINLGRRVYLRHVSDPTDTDTRGDRWEDCAINDSTYLNVKSDGIGIVDISFEHRNGQPHWVLNNTTQPFDTQICQIRDADVHGLKIIRDSRKCRAIIPSSRVGAEPFFNGTARPPESCWVDSEFPVESELTTMEDPFIYFTKATYIPFTKMEKIVLDVDYSRFGIIDIDPNGIEHPWKYPFLQFEVNGNWTPPISERCTVIREVLVDNAVGLWWGTTVNFISIHIGFVLSQRTDLKNTAIT